MSKTEERWFRKAGYGEVLHAAYYRGQKHVIPLDEYAAFEAVKNDPKYGGQLIREEIDLFTMQSLYSILGLGVAVGLLALRVTELVLKKLLL